MHDIGAVRYARAVSRQSIRDATHYCTTYIWMPTPSPSLRAVHLILGCVLKIAYIRQRTAAQKPRSPRDRSEHEVESTLSIPPHASRRNPGEDTQSTFTQDQKRKIEYGRNESRQRKDKVKTLSQENDRIGIPDSPSIPIPIPMSMCMSSLATDRCKENPLTNAHASS